MATPFFIQSRRQVSLTGRCQCIERSDSVFMWRLALFLFLMTAAGVYLPDGSRSPAFAFADDTRNGEAIFKGHCTPCHGGDGKGIAAVGTPDFTSRKIQASLTDADIIKIITNGKEGTIMPAWKGKLSPQEIAAAASYVRSLGGGH